MGEFVLELLKRLLSLGCQIELRSLEKFSYMGNNGAKITNESPIKRG